MSSLMRLILKVSIAVQKAKDHTSHSMEFPMGITQTIQKQLTGKS